MRMLVSQLIYHVLIILSWHLEDSAAAAQGRLNSHNGTKLLKISYDSKQTGHAIVCFDTLMK